MDSKGNCPKCGARLLWIMTEKEKYMPLDIEGEKRWVVVDPAKSMVAKLRNTRTCHFDTCTKGFGNETTDSKD